MEKLKPNQILLEVSEDKKKITITCGAFSIDKPLTFDSCPAKVTDNLSNAINSYVEYTRLDKVPEWKSEECGYEGGECIDCN